MQAEDEKIKQLYEKIKELEKDKKKLTIQLVGEYELKKSLAELKILNQRLQEELDSKIH